MHATNILGILDLRDGGIQKFELRFRGLENCTYDQDVPKSIIIDEEKAKNLENIMIFCPMALS